MVHCTYVVSRRFQRLLILSGAATLVAACDPNVVIGVKWSVGDGGTETVVGGAPAAGDGGTPSAGGAAPADEWCATSPWLNTPVQFTGDHGNVIPPGSYLITYVSGAQIHEVAFGYEVTAHYYGKNALEAGHHIFSGSSPETGATSLWLDEKGIVIVGPSGTIAQVEAANRGHTWPLTHAGGELFVTLYDDDYRDNSGPGSRFCIAAAP
jgi:hypothetical protein